MATFCAEQAVWFNHANSGSPEGFARFPKGVFTRESNIFQLLVVQRIQLLPSMPAN
jgi:hypothetical protein